MYKPLIKGVLALTIIALSATQLSAATAARMFADAPRAIFPLLDRNTRLDMLDYFNSGLRNESKNMLDGGSAITALSDTAISVSVTDASSVSLILLPTPADTLVAVISTVNTPAPDSKISIYSSDWKQIPTAKLFKVPGLDNWLTAEGKKNSTQVQTLVPFMLVAYDIDPKTLTLTLTNNTPQFLSDDVAETVRPYFHHTLTYVWNGKRFTLPK